MHQQLLFHFIVFTMTQLILLVHQFNVQLHFTHVVLIGENHFNYP